MIQESRILSNSNVESDDTHVPIEQIVSATYIPCNYKVHFELLSPPLSCVILVLLLRLRNRVALVGLTAQMQRDGTAHWHTIRFWREAHEALFRGHARWRTQPFGRQLGSLAFVLNRRCWRAHHASNALTGVLSSVVSESLPLPPVMIALPEDFEPWPVQTRFVTSIADQKGITWQRIWRQCLQDHFVEAEQSEAGVALIDSRIWPHTKPVDGFEGSLGEYVVLDDFMGRPVMNPVTRIGNIESLDPDERLTKMRKKMFPDLALGASDEDLQLAMGRPDWPLFLSGVCRTFTMRLPEDALEQKAIRLTAPGHVVTIPTRRPEHHGQFNSSVKRPAMACMV